MTSITDSLMYGAKEWRNDRRPFWRCNSVAIPLVVVSNVVAGFIYHMTSPATKARREERKAEAAHKEKMGEITAMERDLLYAESYLLAKQDTLDKAVLLAEIKKSQDAVEKSTRDSLRDQIGIRNAASNGSDGVSNKVDELKTRLAEMTKKLIEPKADETPTPQAPVPASDSSQPQMTDVPQAKIVPALQIPPVAVDQRVDPLHLQNCLQPGRAGRSISVMNWWRKRTLTVTTSASPMKRSHLRM